MISRFSDRPFLEQNKSSEEDERAAMNYSSPTVFGILITAGAEFWTLILLSIRAQTQTLRNKLYMGSAFITRN